MLRFDSLVHGQANAPVGIGDCLGLVFWDQTHGRLHKIQRDEDLHLA